MVFISTVERDILISYLNDFKELVDDEDVDEFSNILISLYDRDNNIKNSISGYEKSNNELKDFINKINDKLSIKLNKNQKLLEKYNDLLTDNKRLNRINNELIKSNNNLDSKINRIKSDSVDYKHKINALKKDIGYYERVLSKLTVITNCLDDNSYSLDESLNLDIIESSPYYRLIENSDLFDRKYYNDNYLNDNSTDEIAHFITTGSFLDYNPCEDFNTKWYRDKYLDGDKSVNPLVEYLSYGINNDNLTSDYSLEPVFILNDAQEYHIIDESGLFDASYYEKTYNINNTDALSHYLSEGYLNKYRPSEDFDLEWYENTYNHTQLNPLLDYALNYNTHSCKKSANKYTEYEEYNICDSQLYHIIDENDLLDVSWYFTRYNSYRDDLIEDFLLNSKNNYLSRKHYEYINENPKSNIYEYIYEELIKEFDSDYDYSKELKLDIKDSVEYTILSEDELFDKKYYLDTNADVKKNALDPIYHYISYGISEGRNPSKDFITDKYYEVNKHIKHKLNPLVDYIYNNKDNLYDDNIHVELQDTIEYNILDDTKYFDEYYYLNKYDMGDADCLEEYIKEGISKKRNPTENIQIDKLNINNVNDYVDYIINSHKRTNEEIVTSKEYTDNYRLLDESIYFDSDYYIKHNPNINEETDAIKHYLMHDEYYPTSKYFDLNTYIQLNPDIKNADIDPLIHFIKYGINEKRQYKRPKLSPDSFIDNPDLYELYDVIYESELFDESYYIKNNPKVLEKDEDPILHYLKYGVEYDINPSAIFSTSRYLKYNPDIKKTGFNPLYHYLKRGKLENRFMFLPDEYYVNNILENNNVNTTLEVLDKLKEKTTIILPVNHNIDEFKVSLQSILENTKNEYELILINSSDDDKDCDDDENCDDDKIIENENSSDSSSDGSSDSSSDTSSTLLNDELNNLSQIINIEVVDAGICCEKTITEYIKNVTNDVVILSKDVILTPQWLTKLKASAYTNKQAAIITPLTNNSDLLTKSNKNKLRNIYDGNINDLNNKARQISEKLNTIQALRDNSEKYCMYIKKEALDELDIDAIDDNLGSIENQLYNKGYLALTDASTFIYTLDASLNEFKTNKFNEISVDSINGAIDELSFDNKAYEKVLCFTQITDNKVELDDNIKRLSNKYNTDILAIDDTTVYLFKYANNNLALIDNIKTDYSYDTNFFYKIYINILINLKVDLIYTKTFKRLFHPTNRKFTSILDFKQYFEVEELHERVSYTPSFDSEVDQILKTHYAYEETIEDNLNKINFTDKKIAVYTAVTGSYDEPVIPSYVNEDFDYVCFTDNPNLTSDFWDIRLMEESDLDNIRKVRMYKILPHKYLAEYDYTLWIDTNIELTDNIINYVHKYLNNNRMLAIKHIERDCLYDEARVCIDSAKDTDIDVINSQIKRYKDEGYPERYGLISSGVLFRNNKDPEVVKVMEDWFNEILNGSYRDQLSFNYVCWKNNFSYDTAGLFIIKNSYMQLHDHMSKGYVLRNIDVDYGKDYDLKYTQRDVDEILEAFNKISIILPVSKVSDNVIKCIENVIKYTCIDYNLLIVTSSFEDYDILMDKYSSNDNITLMNSDTSNKITNINTAINNSLNDIIILDENTLVSPKYAQKLITKAYSQEMIATVSPITNNDLTMSDTDECANLMGGKSLIKMDALTDSSVLKEDTLLTDSSIIEKKSRDSTIITPLVSNNCVFIKKEAIYNAGFFDVEYESWEYALIDYSLRLIKKGWHNVISPSAYIYSNQKTNLYDCFNNTCNNSNLCHDKGSDTSVDDFQDESIDNSSDSKLLFKNKEYAHDKKIILNRYYEYKEKISEFNSSIEYNNIKRLLRYALGSRNTKKRILYLLHEGVGGTLHTNMDLMKNINPHMDTYLLITSTTAVELYKYNPQSKTDNINPDMEFKNNLDLLRKWKLNTKYTLLNTTSDRLKQIYFNILTYLNIDIVHIRHLIMSTFDMPTVASKLAIPVVLSFHDYYYICPSHNLVDDNKNYCGGICPPLYEDNTLGGQCNIIGDLNIPQTRTIVHWWQDEVSKLFENIDAFITTSKSAYNLYTKHYPQLEDKDFRIIEHGRDLKTPDSTEYVTPINSKDKIKILFPGHIGYTKGYELIKKIKEYDTDDRIEYHYMGSIGGHKDLEEIGINHGRYKRSEFSDIVHKIKPHFIGIFSIWPETYCHTLTEGWASGIPILAVDIGAVAERIKNNGGGFLINNNPKEAYDRIIKLSYNKRLYMKKANKIPEITFKTTEEMASDYMEVYEDYLNY